MKIFENIKVLQISLNLYNDHLIANKYYTIMLRTSEKTFQVSINYLLIPDKNQSSGGYNETITFNVTIVNQSDLSQTLSISDFDVNILYMPVVDGGTFTNRTTAQITFTPNITETGAYLGVHKRF